MTNEVPDWRNSLVAEAAVIFGVTVFAEWARFRRRSADHLAPRWVEAPQADRLQILDLCAILNTNQN